MSTLPTLEARAAKAASAPRLYRIFSRIASMSQTSHPKLLLIAHEGSLSGAPMLLLTFARWLKANTDIGFDILILRDGPLRAEFAALAPTTVADELNGRNKFASRLRNRLFRLPQDHWDKQVFRRLQARGYSVVFGNSIVCLPWLERFKAFTPARCVCAVHELTWTIERYFESSYVKTTLPKMDHVVAGSLAVRNNLLTSYSIPAGQVEVVHSFVTESLTVRQDKAALRRQLGIGPADVVVGAVGNSGLRKGIDLAAPIARALKACDPKRSFKLVWLGGKRGDELVSICKRDALMLDVADQVIIVDANSDANDYIDLCDVFALPSREDTFPLVVLTAIRMGKPVVAFERSGGMDELLSGGAGCLVPYLDVQRFAAAIDHLLSDTVAAAQIVARAKARVLADYGVEQLARRLFESIVPPRLPADMAPVAEAKKGVR